MKTKDTSWIQRFANYNKALSQLKKFVEKGELNELEEQGLIKAFEYTFELGWKVLKDFLCERGNQNIFGSRDAISEAFKVGLIEDDDGWMNMFKDRNKAAHSYNEETAEEIAEAILNQYYPLLEALHFKMDKIRDGGDSTDLSKE
jgi:nucleotidyltransferase substrate binding protein (TIGR01987 family)